MHATRDGKPQAAVRWNWSGLFNRQALFPASVSLCISVNRISIFAFLPLMARRSDLGNIGYYFTLQALTLMAVRFVSGPISDRYGRSVVVAPGMALMAAGVTLLAYSTSPAH